MNEYKRIRSLLSNAADVASDGEILPLRGDWSSVEFSGASHMAQEDFEAIAKAALAIGEEHVYVLEMESLDHCFAPMKVKLTYRDFQKFQGEMMTHFDCVLVAPSSRWFAAMYNDAIKTVVFGDEEFMGLLQRELR